MNRKSRQKKAAFTLMSYLSNDVAGSQIRMRKGRQTVTLLSAWEKELPSFDPAAQAMFSAFRESFNSSTPSPSFPNMNAVWGPMNAALYNTIHKGASPKEAAADAQRRITKALGK